MGKKIAPQAGEDFCKTTRSILYVHEVLINPLGGLSLPRKSVARLTDCPDMTLDVYRGRKTTMQQQQIHAKNSCMGKAQVKSRFIIYSVLILT